MKDTPNDMQTGTKHQTKSGVLEVVAYHDWRNVEVKFIKTGYVTTARADTIRRGTVKDRLAPSVVGVGYICSGDYSRGTHEKIYVTWYSMIERCYGVRYQKRCPTYIGCTVCREWHNFQNFAEWMDSQDYEGKDLDKDIKAKGNKVYSPDTCAFVSHAENVIEASAKHYRFVSPEGVLTEIYNLNSFCREHGLDQRHMSGVHLGKRNQHKGWTRAEFEG